MKHITIFFILGIIFSVAALIPTIHTAMLSVGMGFFIIASLTGYIEFMRDHLREGK